MEEKVKKLCQKLENLNKYELKVVIKEIALFAIVGLSVAGIHFLSYWVFFFKIHLSSLSSNTIAFFISAPFSYFGHFHVTFKDQTSDLSNSNLNIQGKFFITAALSFFLNGFWAWLYVDYLRWHQAFYVISLLCVTPLFTFLVMKNLVFKKTTFHNNPQK